LIAIAVNTFLTNQQTKQTGDRNMKKQQTNQSVGRRPAPVLPVVIAFILGALLTQGAFSFYIGREVVNGRLFVQYPERPAKQQDPKAVALWSGEPTFPPRPETSSR
jgi:hypothetical protein